MSNLQKQTRREFIKIFSLSGTGLLLASYVPLNEFLINEGDEPKIFSPSAFIKIDSDGVVTVFVPKSEMGQGVFTSLPMLVAEELEVDWEKIKIENAYADKKFGSQGTGGSTSIRRTWEPLRVAGATAKTMLITAAATKWGIKDSDCKAEKGFVINKINGNKFSFGELVEEASKLPVHQNVVLKDPKDYKIIGKRIHRKDTPDKIYGSAKFGIDYSVAGMLYATVIHPPSFGGSIKNYDASETKALNGIKDVVTISSGVAIIAESTWLAFKGKDLLSVEWDLGKNSNINSDTINKIMRGKLNEPGEEIEIKGTLRDEQEGDRNIEAVYEVPYLAHATMEPMNCLADVKNGKAEIWAPTQNPQGAQKAVANVLGIKEEDVMVYLTFMGGGFGRRGESDYAVEAAKISKAAGKPVKLVWTRDEDMKNDFYRPPSLNQLKGTINKNGNLVNMVHHVIAPSIGINKSGRKSEPSRYDIKEGAIEEEYNIPFTKITGSLVDSPVPLGYWRAVYLSQNPFASESFIDELAVSTNKDPYEFRRDLLPEDSRLRNVLTLAAEKADWYKKLDNGRGKGIACISAYDSFCSYVAEVTVKSNRLKVDRFFCAIDCGLVVNPDIVEAQIEGSIGFALSAALMQEVTIRNGGVVESNFDDYPILTFGEMPEVEVHIVQNTFPVGGVGELGVGATAPALCNAIFAASGKRIRKLPVVLG
jgi:isoquinoline 1-oxidoreductase beta subunit